MKKVCKIGWVISVILSQACQHAAKTPANYSADPAFVTDIPVEKSGRDSGKLSYSYRYKKEETRVLGLDSLELGYDSLQTRIWLGHSMALVRHLVIISFSNQKWQGRLITIMQTDGKPANIRKFSHGASPKSGWPSFAKALSESNIVTLPHGGDNSVCNKCGGADGLYYSFEIATTKNYRFYEYCNPESAQDCPEAQIVLQFAAYLEKEFGFVYTK